MSLKVAVLASGSGSNLQAMIDKISTGHLDMDIRLVLTNKPDAYALERAKAASIPAVTIAHGDFSDRESFDRAMVDAIRKAGADTVVLAGFMRMLTPSFLEAFSGRVINIHPAILPSFAGVRGAADAHDYGVKISGCTVHFVDEIMDHGPVIVQAAVPVTPSDPLERLQQRIHTLEHRIFPQALQWLAQGRLRQEGRVVHLDPPVDGKTVRRAEVAGDWMVWPPLEEGF